MNGATSALTQDLSYQWDLGDQDQQLQSGHVNTLHLISPFPYTICCRLQWFHISCRDHIFIPSDASQELQTQMYEEVQVFPTLLCYMCSQQTTSLQRSKQGIFPSSVLSESTVSQHRSKFMLTAQSEFTTWTSTRGPEEPPACPPLTREPCQGFLAFRFWTATANELRLADWSGQMEDSLEQEEESSAQELNVWTQANIFIEESEQVRDVGEGQHQERLFQLTKEKAKEQKH